MAEESKRLAGRLAKAALWAAVLLAVAAAAGKWWLAPAAIRWQLDEYLPEYWDGAAEIDRIEFNVFGPVVLGGLALRDRDGQEWLAAKSVELSLRDWPSLSPMLIGLSLDRPRVTAHCAAGQCRPPLRKIPSDLWTAYVDLARASVRGGSIEVIHDGNSVARWDDLHLELRRREGGYRLSLAPTHPLVLEDLRAGPLVLEDDRLAVGRLAGRAGKGLLAASLDARLAPDGRVLLAGQVAAKGVDLARLKLPIRGAEKGLLTGICTFRRDEGGRVGLTGDGMLFVDEADLRNVPAAEEILRRAGLGKLDVLKGSDVEAMFHLAGTVVTLDQARVKVSLAAVDVEGGGTIDAWTGAMDVTAVVVLFEKVRDLLKAIPFVSLVVDLTERLSRFRVTGTWSDSASLVVKSKPAGDVTAGSKRFLTAAARGSGPIGQAIFDGLGGLFDGPDANTPTTRGAAGGGR